MSNEKKSAKSPKSSNSSNKTVCVSARVTHAQREKLSAISQAWGHKNVSETVNKAVLEYMERKRKR